MSDKQSELVTDQGEMTRLRRSNDAKREDDIVEWLEVQRDAQAAIYQMEFQRGDLADYGVINPATDLAERYSRAAEEIKRLRTLHDLLVEAVKNKVLVALEDAKSPPWVPTHRHYKGTLYRVTGMRWDAEFEELVEKVEYDDSDGKKFVLARSRWESMLNSGRPRYEYVKFVKEDGT